MHRARRAEKRNALPDFKEARTSLQQSVATRCSASIWLRSALRVGRIHKNGYAQFEALVRVSQGSKLSLT